MRWVRCPKCRTLNDIDRYALCDGCDSSLTGLPALDASRPEPEVRHETDRDRSVGRLILVILGVLSGAAILAMVLSKNESRLTGFLAALPLFGLFLWTAMARRIHASSSHIITKVSLYIGSAAVAGFGALIILFIICAGSM